MSCHPFGLFSQEENTVYDDSSSRFMLNFDLLSIAKNPAKNDFSIIHA